MNTSPQIYIASPNRKKPLLSAIAALSNSTKGGTVLIGILPNGEVRGLQEEVKFYKGFSPVKDAVHHRIRDSIFPPSPVVPMEWVGPIEQPILQIHVHPGPQQPYTYQQTVYVWDPKTVQPRPATGEERQILEEKRRRAQRWTHLQTRWVLQSGRMAWYLLATWVALPVLYLAGLLGWSRPHPVFIPETGWLDHLSLSPDGQYLAVSHGTDDAAEWDSLLIDTDTRQQFAFPAELAHPWAPAWAPDGKTIYLLDWDTRGVFAYDVRTQKVQVTGRCPEGTHADNRPAPHPTQPLLVVHCW